MFCPECGAKNEPNTQFCAECGFKLGAKTAGATGGSSAPFSIKGFMTMLITIFLKPVTGFKEKLNNFDSFKVSVIFASIVAVITMVLQLLTRIWQTVHVYMRDPETREWGYQWYWDNMEGFAWVDNTILAFLIVLGAIAAVALIYFLAGLIARKEVKYQRALAVATVSLIPLVLVGFILVPILAWIQIHLASMAMIVVAVYCLAMLISGMNEELKLEDSNERLYVNMACIAILVVILYFIGVNAAQDAVIDGGFNLW